MRVYSELILILKLLIYIIQVIQLLRNGMGILNKKHFLSLPTTKRKETTNTQRQLTIIMSFGCGKVDL